MELKQGDLVEINNIEATVVEVLNPNESKVPRCWIMQEGKKYCVFVSDLKIKKG
jgi:hypothetical protein